MNLFHYCSNKALLSILEKKEIWASELELSNDAMEGKWIRKVFQNYCKENAVTASAQDELLSFLDFVIGIYGYAGFCLSEVSDLLSQWRAYADNGAGASIGFNKDYFEALGKVKFDRNDTFSAHLAKIEYDPSEQRKLIADEADKILKLVADGALQRPTILTTEDNEKKRIDKYKEMGFRFLFFLPLIFSLKNSAFAEEREWRIISYILRTDRDSVLGQLAKMDFKAREGRIVPFARIALESLPQPSITEIVLGPRNATPERTVEAILVKYGWLNVSVRKSEASYR
jgi:hypothetical protein